MSEKKIVVQLKVNHGENPINVVESLFANTVKPDLVFLDVSSIEYPHRTMELPWELVEFSCKNPKVKFIWDGNNPLTDDDEYQIIGANQDDDDSVKYDVDDQDDNSPQITYEYTKKSSSKNTINVLVINFGSTFNYTVSVISDLLVQTSDFDLTIVDNGGDNFEENRQYFKMLHDNWDFENRTLHVIGMQQPMALNHLWNYFYRTTDNDWLCFLNNDVGIPDNFISDNQAVIEKEPNAGIISHSTNKVDVKRSDKLIYKVYESDSKKTLHRQGWDFTINRRYFTEIPPELTTFVGDGILFYGVYKNNADVIFLYSSPIIHYCSSSQKGKEDYFKALMKKESLMFNKNSCYQEYGNKYKYAVDNDVSDIQPLNLEQLKRNVYFDDSKRIVVSLTTWRGRITSLPLVLDSILRQTLQPYKIVVNLSKDEFPSPKLIPDNIRFYIKRNGIEINWVKEDTKVYKKIIPTLLKYRDDLILSIDDDFIYPRNMIMDFYRKYMEYPNNPISGNRITKFGMDCHCGCSSLVQYKFYNIFIQDCRRYYENCKSSDIVYTYIANFNGYSYMRTDGLYFNNMKSIPNDAAYSLNNGKYSTQIVEDTYHWLQKNMFEETCHD